MASSLLVQPLLSPSELDRLRKDHPTLRVLDVRTPTEFDAVHIPGAYNVPLDSLAEHGEEIRALDAPVVLVCQTGGRARRAEEALRGGGIPSLHVLEEGMQGWIASGQPVRRGAARMSIDRQVRLLAGGICGLGGIAALLLHPGFALIPALVGTALSVAAAIDSCLLGMLLARLPYNRVPSCDVPEMVRRLQAGGPSAPPRTA